MTLAYGASEASSGKDWGGSILRVGDVWGKWMPTHAGKLFGAGDSSGAQRNRVRADRRCEGVEVSFGQ